VTAARRRASSAVRVLVLVLLAAAPPLAGAVHEPVFVPLLLGSALAGLLSLRADGGRPALEVPGARLVLGLIALALLQLVPLPPALLRVVSPGTYAYHEVQLLVPPLTAWKPISVSPGDTLRGLAFLVALPLLGLAVYRASHDSAFRHRLARTVAYTGVFITVVALVQAASPEPRKLYGLWQPRWDWAVFGPYVNRNHFAGYLVLATPLAVGLALESLARLRAALARRKNPLLALGDAEGLAFLRAGAFVMVMVAGLLASSSRGGVSAFALGLLVMGLAAPGRRRTAFALLLLVALGVSWVGLGGVMQAFEARGVRASRLDLWADMLPMAPRFPLFGCGWNAFATAYAWYQTVWKTDWVGEAHNDYLQALLDGGLLGFGLVVALFATVLRHALWREHRSPLQLGVLGALAGFAFHELVDFGGQIPANAATVVALSATAVASSGRPHGRRRRQRRGGHVLPEPELEPAAPAARLEGEPDHP
jgi:O-antigen ligase